MSEEIFTWKIMGEILCKGKVIPSFPSILEKYIILNKTYSENNIYQNGIFTKACEKFEEGLNDLDKTLNHICIYVKYYTYTDMFKSFAAKMEELLNEFGIDKKNTNYFYLILAWLIYIDKGLMMLSKYCLDNYYCDRNGEVGGEETLIVIGRKVYADYGFIDSSSPFANIRALRLPVGEIEKFFDKKKILSDINLFDNGMFNCLSYYGASNAELEINSLYSNKLHHLSVECVTVSRNNEKHNRVIEPLKNKKIKALILPELFCDESNLYDYVKNSLSQIDTTILIAGIYSYSNSDPAKPSYNNDAVVYLLSGNEYIKVGEYHKIIPSTFNDGIFQCVESLQKHDNNNILLLPFKDGIAGVAICRDVMDLINLDNPIHEYADILDVLFVISSNSAETETFLSAAESLARWHNCATIYTNDSTATTDDRINELSFAIKPYKNTNKGIGSTGIDGVVVSRGVYLDDTVHRIKTICANTRIEDKFHCESDMLKQLLFNPETKNDANAISLAAYYEISCPGVNNT